MMPRWQRAFVIAACALIGGAFAYAACDWGQWPRLTLVPVTGGVTMHPPAGALAMAYLGIVVWGVGGMACGALVGAALCARRGFGRKPWPDRALQLFGAWAITAVAMAGAYYTWSLWPW